MTDPLPTRAALAALAIIHLLMLGALYSQTAPHPPLSIALFGLGPFLSATVAVMAAAWIMAERPRSGPALAVLAAVLAALSLGPHKYVDPAFPLIWPAVLAGQIAALSVFAQLFAGRKSHRAGPALHRAA